MYLHDTRPPLAWYCTDMYSFSFAVQGLLVALAVLQAPVLTTQLGHEVNTLNTFTQKGQTIVSELPPLNVLSCSLSLIPPTILLFVACFLQFHALSEVKYLGVLRLLRGHVDVLIVLALLNGCNVVDGVVLYALSYVMKFNALFVQIADRKKSLPNLATKAAWTCFRFFLIPLILSLAIFSFFPESEISGGGNFNLRYLSAQARRDLSTISRTERQWSTDNITIPEYGIVPYVATTLYVPGAGFLWANAHYDDDESFYSHVVFSDPMNRRYGWAFEQSLMGIDEKQRKDLLGNERVTSYLWPGENIHLRSRLHDAFLSVANFPSSPDSVAAEDQSDFDRYPLQLVETPSENSTWHLRYDPSTDNGFRLYNMVWGCYLATTFDVLSDPTAFSPAPTNDSILFKLKLEAEATCTTSPTKRASTFYLVEGLTATAPRHKQTRVPRLLMRLAGTDFNKHVRKHAIQAWSRLKWSKSLLEAHTALWVFRAKYPHIQTPPQETGSKNPPPPLLEYTETTVVLVFLFTYAGFVIWAKRYHVSRDTNSGSEDRVTSQAEHEATSDQLRMKQIGLCAGTAALFVLAHILAYWGLGYHRRAGPWVAIQVAIIGLEDISQCFWNMRNR